MHRLRPLILLAPCVLAVGWIAAQRLVEVRAPERTSEQETIARLEAIGYLAGVEKAPAQTEGVVQRTPLAAPGPRLYVSGHGPEARLIDVEGEELHRWHFPAERAFDGLSERDTSKGFRRAHVFPNGDLLAIFEGIGIVKIDARSELVWAARNGAHHAIDVMPDGTVFVLGRTAHIVSAVDASRPVLEDFIIELSPDGEERRRVSLLVALLASPHRELATRIDPRLPARNREVAESGDIFHTNSLQIVRRDHPEVPWLRAGQALVSIKHLNAIAVIDLEPRALVWLHQGDFLIQHEARLLDDGNLLLFDNHTRERGSRALGLSFEGAELWQHPPRGERSFFSSCCGAAARLPSGNTLIVVTGSGRAIEVTPSHRIVWEFVSPHRTGEDGKLIAALFDMVQLGEDFTLDWTAAWKARAQAVARSERSTGSHSGRAPNDGSMR